MFDYDPADADTSLIPPGLYLATVDSVDDTTTKKGDPMLVFRLTVQGAEKMYAMDDRITQNAIWKLSQIATATDLHAHFKAKTPGWWDHTVGKVVRVEIVTQKSKDERYGDQSNIKKYMKWEHSAAQAEPLPVDLPFPTA
jgi:hypothetical protein